MPQEITLPFTVVIWLCVLFLVVIFVNEIYKVHREDKKRRTERRERARVQNLEWEEQLRRFHWLRAAVRENHEHFEEDDALRTFILQIRDTYPKLYTEQEKINWKKEGF